MADFNKILDHGDVENGIINVVIEIPSGSTNKIEWHREKAAFQLDRVKPSIFAKPTNYGFIPRTLDEDGDELDALVITDDPIPTGVFLEARVIGVMKFEDEGEVDDKIITVPASAKGVSVDINSLDDIPKPMIDQITHHFAHYKDLIKPGCTIVKGWGDIDEAKEIIRKSIERWDNNEV